MANEELTHLDPLPEIVKLQCGIPVKIEEMRFRQSARFSRIVTRPLARGVVDFSGISLDPEDKENFGARLIFIILQLIPESEDEVVDFLRSMTSPGDLIEKPVLQKSDIETNKRLWAKLDKEMINPSKKDTVMLIKNIIRREAPELQELGKEGMEEIRRLTKKAPSESPSSSTQESTLSVDLPEPATPFNVPTDGPTNTLENSHYEQLELNLQ